MERRDHTYVNVAPYRHVQRRRGMRTHNWCLAFPRLFWIFSEIGTICSAVALPTLLLITSVPVQQNYNNVLKKTSQIKHKPKVHPLNWTQILYSTPLLGKKKTKNKCHFQIDLIRPKSSWFGFWH